MRRRSACPTHFTPCLLTHAPQFAADARDGAILVHLYKLPTAACGAGFVCRTARPLSAPVFCRVASVEWCGEGHPYFGCFALVDDGGSFCFSNHAMYPQLKDQRLFFLPQCSDYSAAVNCVSSCAFCGVVDVSHSHSLHSRCAHTDVVTISTHLNLSWARHCQAERRASRARPISLRIYTVAPPCGPVAEAVHASSAWCRRLRSQNLKLAFPRSLP